MAQRKRRASRPWKPEVNIMYYEYGDGRWLRREWKPQCQEDVFFYGQCQGVMGHKGVHWCYSPSGNFEWDDNADDPKPNQEGCAGSTPPGHKSYPSPVKMEKHYYLSHYTDSMVKDKAILAMLERNKTPEQGASINRPVKDKAILAMLEQRKNPETIAKAKRSKHRKGLTSALNRNRNGHR